MERFLELGQSFALPPGGSWADHQLSVGVEAEPEEMELEPLALQKVIEEESEQQA